MYCYFLFAITHSLEFACTFWQEKELLDVGALAGPLPWIPSAAEVGAGAEENTCGTHRCYCLIDLFTNIRSRFSLSTLLKRFER